jgi:signal transduction histidine kinase
MAVIGQSHFRGIRPCWRSLESGQGDFSALPLLIVDAVELCGSSGWAVSTLLLVALLALLAALALRRWQRCSARMQQHQQLFERDRSARQLHDSLLQGMHGLILRFQAVTEHLPAGDPARGGMDAALQRADEVLNDARDRLLLLRQHDASASGLARALEQIGVELAGDDGVQFRVQVKGAPRELLPAVHDELRQILGEALLNAFRHARARHIVVTLHHGRRDFCADVVDDGIGMSRDLLQQGRPGHWGLSGMRERAECIAATLTLRSRPGAGTSVQVCLRARRAYLPA